MKGICGLARRYEMIPILDIAPKQEQDMLKCIDG